MAGGESGDDVDAEGAGGGDVDVSGFAEAFVEDGELVGGDAQALVGDLQAQAAAEQGLAGDGDCGGGGGEFGGVVEQFGQEVGHVVDGGGHDQVGGHDAEFDAWVLFDFADGGAYYVQHGGGDALAAHFFHASEHEQGFGVSAHAGGQVVDAEQGAELVGVAFAGFEVFDFAELAVDQGLGAAGQVDHDGVQVLPQQGLFTGHPHGGGVDLVDRRGDLADLVGALRGDRITDPAHHRRAIFLNPRHQRRQPGIGSLQRRRPQPPQRPHNRPRHR
ncbi:MAG TPA: hypothetical protein VK925_03380, partial [Jiangellaceae bacterium]|nr:hypothetical protein [Jiangellaceae bacterium]